MNKRLPQNYTPVHYDLYLHIVENLISFDSSVTITFQKNHDDDHLSLNLNPNISIQKITQNKIDLKYTVDYPILTIERSKTPEMDLDSYPITIEYKVSPNYSDYEGFFVCHGNYLTDFEPIGARSLLPCFDEPCIRSTFSVKLLIPSYLTALSNMPAETIIPKDIENEISFLPTPPMCTYLLCLCIGSYSSIVGTTNNGTLVEYFTKNDREELLRPYLDVAIYSLNWLETKFGVKYELPLLQLISLHGFGGGMENYGLITLNDYTYSKSRTYNMLVIMHEITHQWFGDLVCVKYWDSLWLNEGFAEFIEYLIFKDYKPELNAFTKFSEGDGIDCFKYFERGVIVPNESEIDFDSLFDSLVYSKGAFVLKMFYDLIGEESFYKVCSNYLKKFKNKCADVNDFVSIVNSTLNKDFHPFFDNWLKNVGFPVLLITEIESGSEKVGITIAQVNKSECAFNFSLPILYEKDGKMFSKKVVVDDFLIQVDFEFDWVIVNDEIASLCFVVYSENLLNALVIPKIEQKISYLNKTLMKHSVQNGFVSGIVEPEIIQLTNNLVI